MKGHFFAEQISGRWIAIAYSGDRMDPSTGECNALMMRQIISVDVDHRSGDIEIFLNRPVKNPHIRDDAASRLTLGVPTCRTPYTPVDAAAHSDRFPANSFAVRFRLADPKR